MPQTATKIRNAKPSKKPVRLFYERGLYLEVSPSGGKWWRLKYRFDRKEKRLSRRVYPDVSLTGHAIEETKPADCWPTESTLAKTERQLRRAELCRLKVEDIDGQRMVVPQVLIRNPTATLSRHTCIAG